MAEARSKAPVQVVKEGTHPVTDQELAEAASMPKGFKFIEQGVMTVAASKEELDKARADGTVTEKSLRNDPFPAEKTEKPRRKRAVDVFKPEVTVEEESEEEVVSVEKTQVSESEGDLVELDETEFLKASGVYSNFIKTMDDVDKDIDYYQRRVIELDGYEDHQKLFMPESVVTPEEKIVTLKTLRRVANELKRAQNQAQKQEVKHEVPKRAIDMLSEEEKMQLANGENIADILDKLVDLKVNERVQPISRKIQQNEYETKVSALGLSRAEFDEEVRNILVEHPYLKKVLGDESLTLDNKIDLLQKYRGSKYTGADIEAARAAGHNEAVQRELKRKANFTLKPSRATRSVQTANDSEQQKLMAQLAEARRARKEGGRTHVSNIVADIARTRRADRD
jgi:hypothetical protein